MKKISDIEKKRPTQPVRLAVVAIEDDNIFEAIANILPKNIIEIILIGHEKKITAIAKEKNLDFSKVKIINEEDDHQAGIKAVELVNSGEVQIIMNGQETYHGASVIGRAVIDKKKGIRKGKIISHLSLFELKDYHKLIGITDTVMNNMPNLKAKVAITNNAVLLFRILGIPKPKVAALGAVEVVNESMPATMHAALLSKMAQRGQIKNCTIEGPLAFDNAISQKHAIHKGIISDICGDPDIILAPDMETAGILYQSFVFFAQAKVASIAMGASVPIVLTSKIDSPETRVNSLLLAASIYG